MRKALTLAAAVMMTTGLSVAPAQAATVGAKCTTKLAIATTSAGKAYCGRNRNAKTAKRYKYAWVKSVLCYGAIDSYNKSNTQYLAAKAQMADIKAKFNALDPATQSQVATQITSLEVTMTQLDGIAQSLKENVSEMCL